MLPNYEAEIRDQEYAADGTLYLRLPSEQAQPFIDRVTDESNGQVLIEMPKAGSANEP
jgi:hypothetical protein